MTTQFPHYHMVRVSDKTNEALLALVASVPNETKSGFIRKAILSALAAHTEQAPTVAPVEALQTPQR